LSINIERVEKVFDRFEQLKECIITSFYSIGRLSTPTLEGNTSRDMKKGTYGK
jgi:hypothetical protein